MPRLRTLLRRAVLTAIAVAALPAATAGAAGWAPVPTDLVAPGPTPVGAAGLTLSAQGALTATWTQGSGAADLMVADRPAGGPWGAPQRLSGGAGINAPTLVANPAGAQAAAWLEGGYVRVATRAPGGPWDPVAVPLSGPGIGNLPEVAVAPDGTVAVAWVEGGDVQVSVRGVSGAFSSPTAMASATNPGSVALAAGPASDIMLAWTDTSGAAGRVMTAYRPAGGPSFKTPVPAFSGTPNAGSSLYLLATQLAFDASGEVSLIWLRTVVDPGANVTATRWEGKYRTAGASGVFQGLLPHGFDTYTINSTLPSGLNTGTLTTDASGRTSFVWPPLAGGPVVDLATRTPGSGFGATQSAPASATPRIEAAGAGTSLVVVDARVPAVAVAPAGGTLGAFDPTPLTTAGTASRAAVAGDAAGDAAALWATKDGSTFALRATVFDATAPEARDLVVPASATAGTAATLSVTPWDALTAASATWDFGDGATATGATVQHAYASAGDRTVTVTVADAAGNATTATRTVSVAPAPPAAGLLPPSEGAPALSAVRLTHATFAVGSRATALTGRARAARATPRGTVVSWRLSAPATVRLSVTTVPRRGRRARTLGTLRRTAPAGAARLAFSGRLGRQALAPGAYRLTLTATDAARRSSKAVAVRFRIVRGADRPAAHSR